MSCTPATEFERLDLSLQSVGKLDHKIEEAQKRERGWDNREVYMHAVKVVAPRGQSAEAKKSR